MNALGKQWSLRLNKPYSNGGAEDSRRVKPDGFDLEATVAVPGRELGCNRTARSVVFGSVSWSLEAPLRTCSTKPRGYWSLEAS